MKRALASVIAAGIATAALSTVSLAGPNSSGKIELHLVAPTTKSACTRVLANPACESIVSQGNLYPQLYFMHILVTDGNQPAGVAGMQFGIAYSGPGAADGVGVDIFAWTLCATLEFQSPAPTWPNSGAGNLITWDATTRCQRAEPGGPGTGVTANAGYFYMSAYNPATMQITPRPVDGLAKLASCIAEEDTLPGGALGSVGFGGQPGYSPCSAIVPTLQTTWSSVKSLYN